MMTPTYATRVREEIFKNNPSKSAHYPAFCYGLLLFGRRFDSSAVSIVTEHRSVSKLYDFALRDLLGVRAALTEQPTSRGGVLYTVSLTDPKEIARLLGQFEHREEQINRELTEGDCLPAFLCGAFLACGTVNEPKKSYCLEFTPPTEELCDLLFELLSVHGYPPKSTLRRGATVLYYKESEQIEDILTTIGAVRGSLELMELKIYKDLRNRANRSTNCETANIDKLVRAAQQQLDDIARLREAGEL
ncbi:MAG: DNA-binding protein WhiA, partial [Oscillospiraceae bacterium]